MLARPNRQRERERVFICQNTNTMLSYNTTHCRRAAKKAIAYHRWNMERNMEQISFWVFHSCCWHYLCDCDAGGGQAIATRSRFSLRISTGLDCCTSCGYLLAVLRLSLLYDTQHVGAIVVPLLYGVLYVFLPNICRLLVNLYTNYQICYETDVTRRAIQHIMILHFWCFCIAHLLSCRLFVYTVTALWWSSLSFSSLTFSARLVPLHNNNLPYCATPVVC